MSTYLAFGRAMVQSPAVFTPATPIIPGTGEMDQEIQGHPGVHTSATAWNSSFLVSGPDATLCLPVELGLNPVSTLSQSLAYGTF